MPMKNPNHPGDLIRDCLDELGVNVTEGAKALGVTRAALSRLINRKASVSTEMAVRLEKAIGSTAGFWLRLQLNYDLAHIQSRAARPENSRAASRQRPGAACVIRVSLRDFPAAPDGPRAITSRVVAQSAVFTVHKLMNNEKFIPL